MMWTGAGIGITGVVLSVFGGTMMGLYKDQPEYHIAMNDVKENKIVIKEEIKLTQRNGTYDNGTILESGVLI